MVITGLHCVLQSKVSDFADIAEAVVLFAAFVRQTAYLGLSYVNRTEIRQLFVQIYNDR